MLLAVIRLSWKEWENTNLSWFSFYVHTQYNCTKKQQQKNNKKHAVAKYYTYIHLFTTVSSQKNFPTF